LISTGELPDPDDQFHAAGGGSQHTGVDDGFVIKASATTGKAEWIKHYPESNRDAQVVGVDVDASGNVFGSGYSCSRMVKTPSRIVLTACHPCLLRLARLATGGSALWRRGLAAQCPVAGCHRTSVSTQSCLPTTTTTHYYYLPTTNY
jgi:hypothetical protein